MSENNIVRLNKGDKAPNFELESDEYKHYALADFKHQNVVLYFYPKAGTSVCTREAKDFRDNLERFQAEGYAVIGISPDAVSYTHLDVYKRQVASDAGETRDGCGNGHGSSSRVDAMETTLANWNRCKPEILKNGA